MSGRYPIKKDKLKDWLLTDYFIYWISFEIFITVEYFCLFVSYKFYLTRKHGLRDQWHLFKSKSWFFNNSMIWGQVLNVFNPPHNL